MEQETDLIASVIQLAERNPFLALILGLFLLSNSLRLLGLDLSKNDDESELVQQLLLILAEQKPPDLSELEVRLKHLESLLQANEREE